MPKQDARIDIRVPEEEKAKFAKLVKRMGETISETLRRWIIEAIEAGQLGRNSNANK